MENKDTNAQATDISGQNAIDGDKILSVANKLLANPEIIASVASALGLGAPPSENGVGESFEESDLSPTDDKDSKGADQTDLQKDKLPDIISGLSPILSALGSQGKHSDDRRACLLRALKPYLSKDRCEAIDYIIKLSDISLVFRSLSKEAPNV